MSDTTALEDALARAHATGEMTAWWDALAELRRLEAARRREQKSQAMESDPDYNPRR